MVRTLPHGHVAAVLGALRDLGLERVLGFRPSRERDLAIGMIVARVINPASKLATARAFKDETASTGLSLELGIQDQAPRVEGRPRGDAYLGAGPVRASLAQRSESGRPQP